MPNSVKSFFNIFGDKGGGTVLGLVYAYIIQDNVQNVLGRVMLLETKLLLGK